MKPTQYILPAVALVGIAFAVWHTNAQVPPSTLVAPRVAPAGQPQGDNVSGSGIVEPASDLIKIGAQVSGVVSYVNVQVGQDVARGDVLFTVDDRDARDQVALARSGVALADTRLAQARIDAADKAADYARYAAIEDPLAVSGEELSRRKFAAASLASVVQVRRAELVQTRASLSQAQTQLRLHQTLAPIAGKILQVRARPGQAAMADANGDPLVTMGQMHPLHIRLDIDEADIARVDIGAPALANPRGLANRRVRAQFVRVEPLVLPKRSLTNSPNERVDVRVLQIIYRLPEASEGFFAGQQVEGFVPARKVIGK
jgi:multidrug efflux pump subunit AcrA (membrane-fusion protein)